MKEMIITLVLFLSLIIIFAMTMAILEVREKVAFQTDCNLKGGVVIWNETDTLCMRSDLFILID